ncbi:hypothetical protein R3W88_011601 [Solanum pinnatisectum]|uniref:Protein kinase domain-containing protein n=1 Tax=Solanum pinnatisectum TaxID=50273 RepID=A0AAV9L772_9SOLN|nr:hypothetical protein R3W88_011601 [Solanum pinnatisectum]
MEKHIFLLILFFLVKFSISIAASNETDQKALLAFQNLISPSHFLAINWTKNTSYCSWFGVTCNPKRQRVVALALLNLQLQGTISPSLANLSFLRVLNLGNNIFHSGIPYGLGHLPRLRVIDIQNNQLNGSTPTSLFQHQRVQVISLAFNELHGEMWKGPWYVPELRVLDLTNNSLTGVIPPSIGNATNMINFSLFGNRVSSNIPKEIDNLSQLADLSLSDNQFTGSIPAILFNISSLLAIHLRNSSLSGPLLLDEGNISLSFNNINGKIPRNIGCLAKLEVLYIGRNAISGTIPASLGNISTMQNLDCSHSRIVVQVPQELGKLSNLRLLNFEHNYNLIGQIPEAIFNISSLETIAFNSNNLSGRIPSTTGPHLPNLKGLYQGDNHFEGEIPLFIINASKLEILRLAQNFLTGAIPTNLGNLPELCSLLLYHNQLTNEPRDHELRFFNSLADCRILRYLQVGYNPLNGVLPNSIGNLSSTIQKIEIGDTHVNGIIPTSIGNISGIMAPGLVGNNLTGSIPSDVGHIVEEVCHLSNLVELTLDDNKLTGLIAECIGYLSMLQVISLSSNTLSSTLNSTILCQVDKLKILGFVFKCLVGTIPKSLEKLMYLKAINVSFNNLEGEIPNGGVFVNSTLQSFLGNIGLCGMHILESKELMLKIVTLVIISSFMILLLISIWIMKRKKKGKSKDVEKVLEIRTYQLTSCHEIQRATNNFDESNLIGEGSSDSVYKGTLSSGTAVAIKVLDLENEKVCKRFDNECEVIRNVRHKILSLAFVLQFMPNGSLENLLYKEEPNLKLLQRVIVMLDVAMAIEYLHHGNPSNVLLDEDMVAHVGDFGISKILAVSKSMAHTETLGSLGYIAPEYGLEGIVSTSGDVYSYDIMLMEVLTKRRPTDEEICNENLDLRKWITQSFSGTLMDVVDANLFLRKNK